MRELKRGARVLDSETCERRAAELRRFAERAADDGIRARFLEMAMLYEELAALLRNSSPSRH